MSHAYDMDAQFYVDRERMIHRRIEDAVDRERAASHITHVVVRDNDTDRALMTLVPIADVLRSADGTIVVLDAASLPGRCRHKELEPGL